MKIAMLRLLLGFLVLMPAFCAVHGGSRDPVSHETATRQARPRLRGEKFDPRESDPQLRRIFALVDAAAERAVSNTPRDERFIFHFWSVKKRMLRQKHGIDWKTPAELNPNIAYDSYGQPRVTAREIREITPLVQKQMRQKEEKITSFERTFEGDVNVWTQIGKTDQQRRYVIRRENNIWKIVHHELVMP